MASAVCWPVLTARGPHQRSDMEFGPCGVSFRLLTWITAEPRNLRTVLLVRLGERKVLFTTAGQEARTLKAARLKYQLLDSDTTQHCGQS